MGEQIVFTAVAFLAGDDGRMNVLYAIDVGGKPLFDGEPALMVSMKSSTVAEEVEVEGAEALSSQLIATARSCKEQFARQIRNTWVDGIFEKDRLLGGQVTNDPTSK